MKWKSSWYEREASFYLISCAVRCRIVFEQALVCSFRNLYDSQHEQLGPVTLRLHIRKLIDFFCLLFGVSWDYQIYMRRVACSDQGDNCSARVHNSMCA